MSAPKNTKTVLKIVGTAEAWDSGVLGADEAHAKKAPSALSQQIDEALAMQMISIRLDQSLIDSFKLLGKVHGVGYQPLMRDALKRFADSEMKLVVHTLVESRKPTVKLSRSARARARAHAAQPTLHQLAA